MSVSYYSDNLVNYKCDYGANLLHDVVSTKYFDDIFYVGRKKNYLLVSCPHEGGGF